MPMAYTKLFASIVHSTIWREPAHVKIVWVTMLALASRRGVVSASLPGLADCARVTLEECVDAIERLKAPDKHSRSKAQGGRRVEEVEGGWSLINYRYYRDLRDEDENRLKDAERQRRHREETRSRNVTAVTPSHEMSQTVTATLNTNTNTNTKERTDSEPAGSVRIPEVVKAKNSSAPRETWLTPYMEAWTNVYGGEPNAGLLAKSIRPLHDKHGQDLTLVAWRSYLAATEAAYVSLPKFSATFGTWLARAGGITGKALKNAQEIRSFIAEE
jgi:hypothetical protein